MKPSVSSALAVFGSAAKAKLANPGASGEPEDQLRAPFEPLLADLAELCGFPRTAVAAVGEASVSDLKTRPDYAVTVHKALVGFIELKAPGKGADPREFRDPHDKAQWEKLHSLPNQRDRRITRARTFAVRLAHRLSRRDTPPRFLAMSALAPTCHACQERHSLSLRLISPPCPPSSSSSPS